MNPDNEHTMCVHCSSPISKVRLALLEAGDLTTDEIVELTGLTKDHVKKTLKSMRRLGQIESSPGPHHFNPWIHQLLPPDEWSTNTWSEDDR